MLILRDLLRILESAEHYLSNMALLSADPGARHIHARLRDGDEILFRFGGGVTLVTLSPDQLFLDDFPAFAGRGDSLGHGFAVRCELMKQTQASIDAEHREGESACRHRLQNLPRD